jgi:hypothetical protein
VGVKQQECEADHSPPSSAEVNNVELYHYSSIHFHNVVLNELITETILHLPWTDTAKKICTYRN